jgi:hypothetical protein
MTWEALAAIAQLAAVVGLIPSLIYLAIQLREQNKERRRAAVAVLTGQWAAMVKTFAESSEFAEIYLRGIQQFDALSPAERLRFGAFLSTFFKNFEGLYYYHKDGTLEPAHWTQVTQTITDLASYPGTQAWWSVRRHRHTEEFATLVDRMIKEAPEAKAYDLHLKESRAAI